MSVVFRLTPSTLGCHVQCQTQTHKDRQVYVLFISLYNRLDSTLVDVKDEEATHRLRQPQ